jgi:hypothetical protein
MKALSRMTRGDKLLVIFILVISLIGTYGVKTLSFDVDKKYAVIESQGEMVAKVSLGPGTQDQTMRVKGPLGYSIVEIGKDKVRMLESPCPGEVSYCCYELGWISQPGQIVVCLPNQVVIRVVGEKNNVDDTAY